MAETIYTKDGKCECIFSNRDFEYLIEKYIGDDAVRYYRSRIETFQSALADCKSLLQDVESAEDCISLIEEYETDLE